MPQSTVLNSSANTPESKVAELSLLLSNDAYKDKCALLVEGPDDRVFYNYYIDEASVVIDVQVGCGLIPDVLSLISSINQYKDRVIGIKDADFDHIKRVTYGLDTLFVTDTHDWETMTMTKECEEKVSLEVIERRMNDVFGKVMSDISNYSYLKFYNDVEICGKGLEGISFRGFSISKVYDGVNECSIDTCLMEVNKHANNSRLSHFPSKETFETFIKDNSPVDLYQLSCGHDVIHSLVCKFAKELKKQPTTGYSTIGKLFRSSYSVYHFKDTFLYKNVLVWSERNNKKIWR